MTLPADSAARLYKSRPGLARVGPALRHSWRGLGAAWRHEVAFRQEVVVGLPLVLLAGWVAATPWQALGLVAAVVAVWVAELLNSAVEAVADRVNPAHDELIGRAKDLGSAAVLLTLLLAAAVWGLALAGRAGWL